MLRTSAQALLSAAALILLGGCTITTYNSSNPPPRRKAAQAQPAANSKPSFRKPATTTAGTKTTTTTPTTTTPQPSSDVAPRITSTIAFGNGTGGAFRGLAYVIPESTTSMPDFGSMVPFATLYTDSFDIRQQDFAGGFPGALAQEDWFGIRYEGRIVLPSDGTYELKINSDDGAILYIDGQKVVDNDGRHFSRVATGKRELKGGSHTMRLDYFQALKGKVALQVYLVENGKDRLLMGTK